jgi:hypothetical protein
MNQQRESDATHLGAGCVPVVGQREHGGGVRHSGGQRHRRVAADERVPLAGGGAGGRRGAERGLQREAEVRGGLGRREGRRQVGPRGGRRRRERREASVVRGRGDGAGAVVPPGIGMPLRRSFCGVGIIKKVKLKKTHVQCKKFMCSLESTAKPCRDFSRAGSMQCSSSIDQAARPRREI